MGIRENIIIEDNRIKPVLEMAWQA